MFFRPSGAWGGILLEFLTHGLRHGLRSFARFAGCEHFVGAVREPPCRAIGVSPAGADSGTVGSAISRSYCPRVRRLPTPGVCASHRVIVGTWQSSKYRKTLVVANRLRNSYSLIYNSRRMSDN